MAKLITVSMGLLLCATTGALAGLSQDQITGIGLTNTVALLSGAQAGSSMQNLVVDNAQFAEEACGYPTKEHLFAAVGQSGSADGYCGIVDVIQGLGIDGVQRQRPGEQLQKLDVVAGQSLGKSVGLGSARGLQTIAVDEGQSAGPICLLCAETTVVGMQTGETSGQPGATNIVDTSMAVSTGQSQGFL